MRTRTKDPSQRDTVMVRVEVRRSYHEQIKQLSYLDRTPIYKIIGEALAAGIPKTKQRVSNDLAERKKREQTMKQASDPRTSWAIPTEGNGQTEAATAAAQESEEKVNDEKRDDS
ncbi:MAG: hypothetical protein HN742_32750 [Lentisphaerae bacterium]|nr:hypothetical protein [Lentisphaerota bacterium]MBT7914098.1 hypothetical protein [Candidatus Bathyarchaeota archaeon]MBT4815441.1 hypothetical protein [Lentisphaerota bacterium]MBT5605811.1 hypothetical protein [Lentisphaerota bacterium]MBT7055614.1 hypothetical protein [Lentisphaerota bacterium]